MGSLFRGIAVRMYYTQSLLPIILPLIFWAAYHYHHDRHLPEPVSHLLLALVLGAGSFYIGLWLYQALGSVHLRYDAYLLAAKNPLGLLAYSMLVIGPIEEVAKLVPFLLVIVRFREFDEPIDGIIYASFIGLGFGAMENLNYLPYVSGLEAWGRAFMGPMLHIVFASIWGYFVGRAYLCGRRLLPVIVGSLALAAGIHGVYDFVVIGMVPQAMPVAAVLIVTVWVWRLKCIRDLHTLPAGPCPQEPK